MTEHQIRKAANKPSVNEYISLRRTMGWGDVSPEAARTTLEATIFVLCLRNDDDELVGLIRLLGDGVLYLFIADVIVHPAYAGKGLGDELMQEAMQYIERVADPQATVTVTPLVGREGFYERFGFERCANKIFGHGLAYMTHLKF